MDETEITRQLTTFEELVRHLSTKEDLALLKSDLATVKSELLEHLLISERGQRAWIWGLYGLILVIAGAQWAGVTLILHVWKP
jgi:hypothetical protein